MRCIGKIKVVEMEIMNMSILIKNIGIPKMVKLMKFQDIKIIKQNYMTGNGYGNGKIIQVYSRIIPIRMKRSELDDSEFGLPELRKYPMPDKDHVLSAIKFFNYVSQKMKRTRKEYKEKDETIWVSSDHVGEKTD